MNHDDASNSGGRTPGSELPASPPFLPRPNGGVNPGPVPVHRALNVQPTSPLPSQHEHKTSTTVDELRQVINHTAPVVAYNGHATTSPELNEAAVARLSSPRLHKRTAGPAQKGNRPPCRRTGERRWSDNSLDHGKPPLRINRENLHDLQPGTSITLRSNRRNWVVHNSLDLGNLPLYPTWRNVQEDS